MLADWQASQAKSPTAASPDYDALGNSMGHGVTAGETKPQPKKTSRDPVRMGTDCYRKVPEVVSLGDLLSLLAR